MSFTSGMSYVYNKTDPPRTARTRTTLHRHLEGTAFPNSTRIYITGSQADIRVPMREIQLSPTLIGGSKEPAFEDNEAVPVYDTLRPVATLLLLSTYSRGKTAQPWIDARNDCEELSDALGVYQRAAWPTTVWTSCALPPADAEPLKRAMRHPASLRAQVSSRRRWSSRRPRKHGPQERIPQRSAAPPASW